MTGDARATLPPDERDRAFETARAATRAAAQRTTYDRRLDWLEEMLDLARASGALAREVHRRRGEPGQ